MPERSEKLRTTLADLHQQLAQAGSLDADSRALLQEALREILDTLESSPSGAGLPGESSLIERLRDAGRRVEGEHPKLAAVVERLLDTIASLGI
jgi:vacuolar-type H+-ATPase catalytic subunit A/Vma1